jgi:hypothetical protein
LTTRLEEFLRPTVNCNTNNAIVLAATSDGQVVCCPMSLFHLFRIPGH